MSETTLARVVKSMQEGDHDAFRVLFERVHDRLFVYAASRSPSRDQALDLVQETFVDIWKQRNSFTYHDDERLLGLIFLILKRKMIKRYRDKNEHHESLDERTEKIGDHDEELSFLPHYEDHRLLQKVIDQLSSRSKEVIVLRYWSDLSFQEIAVVLSITETAAKVRHHRAVKELKEKLLSHGYE